MSGDPSSGGGVVLSVTRHASASSCSLAFVRLPSSSLGLTPVLLSHLSRRGKQTPFSPSSNLGQLYLLMTRSVCGNRSGCSDTSEGQLTLDRAVVKAQSRTSWSPPLVSRLASGKLLHLPHLGFLVCRWCISSRIIVEFTQMDVRVCLECLQQCLPVRKT